jgi:acyl-coenzyme A thioesterase PaaI-like protein
VAPGRRVAGIDARFIRGFRPGTANVVAVIVNEGRTLSTVQVDVSNAQGKLCTRALVALVNPESLADVDHDGAEPPSGLLAVSEGTPWAQPEPPMTIPLLETFEPTFCGRTSAGTATAAKTVWDGNESCAEAVCIAADLSVGPPVARAMKGHRVGTPNPDISLRFGAEVELPDFLVACCRLQSLVAGLASTAIDVWAGSSLLATGVSTTTCIRNPSS